MTTLETLLQLLPEGWKETCFTCGAIKQKRKLRNLRDWIKLCFIYLMENCSMVQLSAIASMLEIADLSNVALLDRLGVSKAWLAGKIMVALLLEKEIGELNCFP